MEQATLNNKQIEYLDCVGCKLDKNKSYHLDDVLSMLPNPTIKEYKGGYECSCYDQERPWLNVTFGGWTKFDAAYKALYGYYVQISGEKTMELI